jgi:hypothetical protein
MAEQLVKLGPLAKERSLQEMRQDCARAFEAAKRYHAELRGIYKYLMPWRQPTSERAPEAGGPPEGQSIADYIFDATGVSAAANYAGQMMADWFPPHQDFMKLEAGPLVRNDDEKKRLNERLGEIAYQVHAVSDGPSLSVLEHFYDHFGGTGSLLVEKGDSSSIVNAAAPPMVEIAIENGPWGMPWHIFWKRKRMVRELPALWPNGEVSAALAQRIRDNPASTCHVVQYSYYDLPSKRWRLAVWVEEESSEQKLLHEAESRTCPWMIDRMFLMPGETMGRGLAHLALPFVKTANRGRELALKAAVISILGIWLRRNDSVFNPDTAVFEPGAMWAVASTGGVLGPSVQRLPTPQDFDIASIVMQEERDQIRRVLLDDELPPEQDAVRSATEVAGRLRRYARNRGGTGVRIGRELITPYTQRVVEILEDLGAVKERINIDQILAKCTVTAPAAAAQRTDKIERAVNWIQMIVMLFGPQAALLTAKVEEMLPEIGRWMGNDERFIRGKTEVKELKEFLAQMVAAQQQAEVKATPRPPAPGQQYVSGGLQ